MAASVTTVRVVTTTPSVATNIMTGTTAAPTVAATPNQKGVTVNFQNQSTGAFNIYIGGSDVSAQIGATSTTAGFGVGGVVLNQNGSYTVEPRNSPSAINFGDWYIVSTSSLAICVAQLVKYV